MPFPDDWLAPPARALVESAVRTYRTELHCLLRQETNLSLPGWVEPPPLQHAAPQQEEDPNANLLPIVVSDGYPQDEGDLTAILRYLLALKSELQTTADTLEILHRLDLDLRHLPELLDGVRHRDPRFDQARRFIENLLSVLERAQGTKEDLFGDYDRNAHTVTLYWRPIALFSKKPLQGLAERAVVILAHEMAHGYLHLGLDEHGVAWSSHFDDVDEYVREGLAEYFSEAVMSRIAGTCPKGMAAYRALLKTAPDLYTAHLKWCRGAPYEIRSAVIRHTILMTREHARNPHVPRYPDQPPVTLGVWHELHGRATTEVRNGNDEHR